MKLELEYLEERMVLSASSDAGFLFQPVDGDSAGVCGVSSEGYTTATPAGADNFVASGAKWAQPGGAGSPITITYSFHSSVLDGSIRGVAPATVKSVIQEALGVWARYAPLNFVEVADSGPNPGAGQEYYPGTGPMIRFSSKYQDGAYNTLAYAYYPYSNSGLAGDVVYDSAEQWSTSPAGGIDFLEVTVHELGHALGLGHETGTQAVMNPVYGRRYSGLGTAFLYNDDINGIRTVYGSGFGSVILAGAGGSAGGAGSGSGNGGLGVFSICDSRAGISDEEFGRLFSSPTVVVQTAQPEQHPSVSAGGSDTFSIIGGTLHVTGTSGNDRIDFLTDGASFTIWVNGELYTGSRDTIHSIVINGNGGQDVASFFGTTAEDVTAAGPASSTVAMGSLQVQLQDVADIRTGADPSWSWSYLMAMDDHDHEEGSGDGPVADVLTYLPTAEELAEDVWADPFVVEKQHDPVSGFPSEAAQEDEAGVELLLFGVPGDPFADAF